MSELSTAVILATEAIPALKTARAHKRSNTNLNASGSGLRGGEAVYWAGVSISATTHLPDVTSARSLASTYQLGCRPCPKRHAFNVSGQRARQLSHSSVYLIQFAGNALHPSITSSFQKNKPVQ